MLCKSYFCSSFAFRLVGTFQMVLQKVAQDGYLELTDTLVDDNNTATKVGYCSHTGVCVCVCVCVC